MRARHTIVVVAKIPAPSKVESATSNAQFDRLLGAVRTAIEPARKHFGQPKSPLKALNENYRAWPLVPFPEGWSASPDVATRKGYFGQRAGLLACRRAWSRPRVAEQTSVPIS